MKPKAIVMVSIVFGLALAAFGLLGVSLTPTGAATLTVCPAGPPTCGYTTIQAALELLEKVKANLVKFLGSHPEAG